MVVCVCVCVGNHFIIRQPAHLPYLKASEEVNEDVRALVSAGLITDEQALEMMNKVGGNCSQNHKSI